MNILNSTHFEKVSRPIAVMQYGEGNFLRAFVDYMIDIANEKGVTDLGVAIVKPITFGNLDRFVEQDNLFTVMLRGRQDGKTVNDARIVSCVQEAVDCYAQYERYMEIGCLDTLKIIFSNTTEAGIVFDANDKFDAAPPATFPGKLTKVLYERFKKFGGDPEKGLVIIPCELIEHNGDKLHTCVDQFIELWQLGAAFKAWVDANCTFCCTLVDRIVTGYPRDSIDEITTQLGYTDNLVDAAEPFGFFVIESKQRDISHLLPLDKAGLPVVFTDDQTPYRERKVRILNGAHTSTVLAGYLAGFEIVGEIMQDADVRKYMETVVFDEIAPTVRLPHDEVIAFANSVFERFENPFIRHRLLDISLNSVSKWKSRILPSFRDSVQANGKLPKLLTFSFAALLAFYTSDTLVDGVLKGTRGTETYDIKDDAAALEFFAQQSKALSSHDFVKAAAARADFWGEDLNAYEGFADTVAAHLETIKSQGMKAVVHALVQ